MNWLDYVFLGILLISTFMGLFKGLVRSVLSILAVVLGFAAAAMLAESAAPMLESVVEQPQARMVAAYIGIFLVVYIAMQVAAWLIARLLKTLKLSWMDRTGGAVFGLLRGLVFCGAILLLLNYLLESGSPTLKRSRLRPPLNSYVVAPLVGLLPEDVGKEFKERRKALGEILGDSKPVGAEAIEKLKETLKDKGGMEKAKKVIEDVVEKGKKAAKTLEGE